MKNFEPIFANDGYRPNVGIIICNQRGQLFWGRRVNQDGWQFPQGGVSRNESLVQAMYRELFEETGLQQSHVRIVAHTKDWVRYDVPHKFIHRKSRGLLRNHRSHKKNNMKKTRVHFKGQKQVWFLLELLEDESVVNLAAGLEKPEFDQWRWVDAPLAIADIVDFKRQVYQHVLSEFDEYLPAS